jgi:spore coat polysaccharide biosynthesis protein SpsF
VLATSDQAEDDPVATWALDQAYEVVRGHPTDVLDRYYQAVEQTGAEVIVRLTGDCPLLDSQVVERTIQYFLQADPPLDFAANRLPDQRSYPIGLDTEVCSKQALVQAWREAEQPHQREHVMPYLYESDQFRIGLMDAEVDWGQERWTVDTEADLNFIRAVFEHFTPRLDFGWREVLALLKEKPALRQINAEVRHRDLLDTDERFSTADHGKALR